MAETKQYKKINVRQTRSGSGFTKRVKETLCALGLGRIGKEKTHNASPALLGMIRRVEHLVSISLAK